MKKVDYLIIGGGIAGITLKHFLKNKRTVLLEATPGKYKIGESIIPEHFRHPELRKLIPDMVKCPSYSPKQGSTFIDQGSVASFPLPPGALTGAMHITRTEMEQVMLDHWGVERVQGRVVAVDLKKKIVRTEDEEYQVANQIIDCSGPSMCLANLLNQVKILWPVCTTWAYWDVVDDDPKKFYAAIAKRKWSWLRYDYGRVIPSDSKDWSPSRSTILTKIKDGMWTWEIPLYRQKLLSYGVVYRGKPIPKEEYCKIASSHISPNYTLKMRPLDESGIYNRMYVRNNFARSAAVPATMDYIMVSDAFCFADPIYSVGSGLAINKAIEVATVLNETGWSPEICQGYCEHYAHQLKGAVEGFQFWYDGKTIRQDSAAKTVQDQLLVGNTFQANITYHYVRSLASSDLSPRLYPADRFAVDWSDPKMERATRTLTRAVRTLLDVTKGGDVAGWTFLKARPAVDGLLLAWKGGSDRPPLRLLVSKAPGKSVFRNVGPLAVSFFIAKNADSPAALHQQVGALVDELEPKMLKHADEWGGIVEKVTQN